jgi:HEAT repeat protein
MVTLTTSGPLDTATLVDTVREMVELACVLSREGKPVARLLEENACRDASPVRVRHLTVLQQTFPESEAARRASLAAVRDPHAELRLQAAVYLADEAADRPCGLARDGAAREELRVRAAEALTARCSPAVAAPRLEELFACELPAVRRVAIEGLGRLRHASALERLAQIMPEADRQTGPALAEVLGLLGDASVEPHLLSLLSSEDDATKAAAARALAKVGTVAAVEPLLRYTKSLALGSDLERVAREAIGAIQSRLGDVQAGRLALAEAAPEDGGLSLAPEAGGLSVPSDAAPGGLSVAEDPAGSHGSAPLHQGIRA